ncbi:MAG: phage head closure protein [Oscillospiraceae bacterium]|nr:phage head closure protein [Oscillospiraceae bacterium]
MNINPGDLNKKIQIILQEKTRDADGYYTTADQLVRSCWAQFSRTSGSEIARSDADFAEVNARFLVRYTATEINRKMAVAYNGNVYDIEYVNDYGDSKEYIEIWAVLRTMEAEI